jgi:8-oxo-dGTP diphosphatase
MPPADRPVVAALMQPPLYLVTPTPIAPDAWLRSLEAALSGGIRRVQLRAPGCDPATWARLAAAAVACCRAAGAEVLVNGDAALATRLRAGLHLRAAQLQEAATPAVIASVRAQGGTVGVSCHDVADLQAAQALGCDFAVLGPVLPTASHPGVEGLGWAGFAALREGVSLPLYGIGGLAPCDVADARNHGAQGIAAISSLWPAASSP